MTYVHGRTPRDVDAKSLQRRRIGGLAACTLAALCSAGFDPAVHTAAQRSVTPHQAAEAAFRAGRYDEVDALAAALDQNEATLILRARAAVARGEYPKAENLLSAPAAKVPTGDAALELALLQQYLGRRVEARRAFQVLLLSGRTETSSRDAARAARAARALGRFQDANTLYRDAVAAAPSDPALETAWGELFLEKYDRQNASRSFQAAIKADSTYGPAHVGMARAIADENPPSAKKLAERALEINPSDTTAHLFLAELAIDEDRRDEARQRIARAQQVNPHSLEAHALTAAVAAVDGREDDYSSAMASALKLNPGYGEAHRVVGSVIARFYRFDEAVDHTRRAIAVDRENARAHADLGVHLMRTGDERAARRSLETAFRADPFDVITYNLLGLLDTLEPFETIRDGELLVRLHPEEAGVMREYAPALARQALDDLSARWNFTPKGPILIELFPRHDDFAVRNVGLPGMIGALGACFGRVVTLDSPKARPPGSFNWGATLWHEMAHVITLQLSNQRIPRWLTEGISVFEEKRARPEWGREMEIPFARALDLGQVLKLDALNAGFQNPETISLAYYQASLLVEHLAQAYGEAALRSLVESFAGGIDTRAAIEQVLHVNLDAVQLSFDAFLDARFKTLRAALSTPEGLDPGMPADRLRTLADEHPGSFAVQMALGQALQSSDPAAAIRAFERASALLPMATGAESPEGHIAVVAFQLEDKPRMTRALEALSRQDHTDADSGRKLAALLDPVSDRQRLREALERVVAIDPFDVPSHSTLGRLALEDGRAADAVRAFRVALAGGALDRAAAHADLAEGLLLGGQRDEAKKHALAALEVAPTYERAQDLLLKLTEAVR